MFRMKSFFAGLGPILLLPLTAATATEKDVLLQAERFVREQTRTLPGEVRLQVGPLDPSLRLPACSALQTFLPPGTRLWGKASVGVRCQTPHAWSVLVPVHVAVHGPYVYLARPINAGQTLEAGDLALGRADLTSLPAGTLSETAAAIGKTLRNTLAGGQPLRADQLLSPILVRQGQTVRLFTRGDGFSASSEGKSLSNASAGQVAQVRVASGKTLSGIVQEDGRVEIIR